MSKFENTAHDDQQQPLSEGDAQSGNSGTVSEKQEGSEQLVSEQEPTHSSSPDNSDVPALCAQEALDVTRDWADVVASLEGQIDSAFRYPLRVVCPQGALPHSVDAYQNTRYTTADQPTLTSEEGLTTYRDVSFKYHGRGGLKHVGTLDFIVTDAEGHVVEVGARSSETLRVFRDNIFGRDIQGAELERLYDVNEKLIDALRADPGCAEKLRAFYESRDHRKEWSDSAKLAYYDPQSFDIISWAKTNQISLRDLYHAGFVERTVTATNVSYRERPQPVVFIPFRDNDDRIVLWRRRVIKPKNAGDPKYLSAPLERSDRYPQSVHRELYQSELLQHVRDKPLIITEGEFKCLVTTKLTGIATVGITGITQVTDNIISKIVEATPSNIVVLLDRDPIGKSFARTDALTDSERAAFFIAERLTRAGAPNVLVGTLPNHFDGDKVGIDDWLLDVNLPGRGQAPGEHLRSILKTALPAREWLKERSNDPELQELLLRVQRLRQIQRDFTSHITRSGRYPPGTEERATAEGSQARVDSMLRILEAAKDRHLKERYNGARRINQPPRRFLTLYTTGAIRDQERKCLVTHDGRVMLLDQFKDPILSLRAIPLDLGSREKLRGAEGLSFPISMSKLSRAFEHPRHNTEIAKFFLRGTEILTHNRDGSLWNGLQYRDFIQRVFAGWLANYYPPSEYRYEKRVNVEKIHRTHREKIATVPLALFKDGEIPVAFCFLPFWNSNDARDVKDPVDRQEAVRNLARQASLGESWSRAAIRSALRGPSLEAQREQFDKIAAVLSNACGVEGQRLASEQLARFGIDPAVAIDSGALFVSRDQWTRLPAHLRMHKLVNQSVQSGLLRRLPLVHTEARFHNDAILIPERDPSGRCVAFSILPAGDAEYKRGSLPPVPKLVYTVDSIRSTTPAFDRSRTLFPNNAVSQIKDKVVLIAPSELECLQLRSVVHTSGRLDIIVLGIRELDSLARSEYAKLAQGEPKRVIFVGQAAETNTHGIRYASLALHDPNTSAAKYLRTNPKKDAPPVSSIVLKDKLAYLLIEASKDEDAAKRLIEDLLCTAVFKTDERITAKLDFSELLADVECTVALRGKQQELPFTMAEMVQVLRDLYGVAYDNTRSLEEFLSDRYLLPVNQALEALERGVDRPLYRPGRGIVLPMPARLRQDLLEAPRLLGSLAARGLAPQDSSFSLSSMEVSSERAERDPPAQGVPSIEHLCSRAAHTLGCAPPSVQHDVCHVLGRVVHRISVALELADSTIKVRGTGSSKKAAEEIAWRSVERALADLPERNAFKLAYEALDTSVSLRRGIEAQMESRKCLAFLNREINSLQRRGIAVALTRGEQQRLPSSQGWEVPYTLSFEGREVEVSYPAFTPTGSENLAAARLLLHLRTELTGKRARNEYSAPTTVVQDLTYLADILKVFVDQPEPQVNELEGKKTFTVRWSINIGSEVISSEATAFKKVEAQRLVAAELLHKLEEYDSAREILAWE